MSDAAEPVDATEREGQRAGLAWALADLAGLRARGVIDAATHERLRRDYEARLRQLDAPPSPPGVPAAPPGPVEREAPPPAPPAPPPTLPAGPAGAAAPAWAATETVVAPDAAAPLSEGAPPALAGAGRGFADLWINITLCLGAFFFVIAALIFVRFSGVTLSEVATAGIMLGFTAAFIVGGLFCLGIPKVRPAGHAFLAVGALLTPLDIIGLYNFVLADRGLSLAAIWALGSAYCMVFYGALAARRLGLVYAGAAVLSAVSAWGGLIATIDPPESWVPALALVLPPLLLGAGRLLERDAAGRAAFGPIPAVAAHLLTPLGMLLVLFAIAMPDRRGVVAALALATLFYVAAAWSARGPGGAARMAAAVGALGAGSLLVLSTGYAARIPWRGYPALLLANAWGILALAIWARRRGAAWADAALFGSLVQAALLTLPWGFLVSDDQPAYWTALFALQLLYWLLLVWYLRQSWFLYPAALALALTTFHALRTQVAPSPSPYAWPFALLAVLPVAALRPLRARGASRVWDANLVVIGQFLAVAAATLALAGGDKVQLAAVLWLFVLASAAVVAVERREELLALPTGWALFAVAAALDALGVERRWAEVVYAAIGLALAIGLQAWRGVPNARRPGWYMAHRWLAGIWAACGPVLSAINLSGPFGDFLVHRELRELVLDYAYLPAMLSVALCGVALAADAVFTLRRPTGYGASAVLMAAALMGIARITPNNPQAYSAPLGIYLLGLSVYVAYERDLGPVRMPAANGLLASAVAVILGTTFAQSLVHPWRYTFLGLLEGLALLAVTLFLRRRYGVALTLLFLAAFALRAAFDVARELPYWAIIGLLGLLLLGGGFFILLRRDRIEQWGAQAARRWSRLM